MSRRGRLFLYGIDGYVTAVVHIGCDVVADDFDDFEWDESKSEQNVLDRGYDFRFASRIFDSFVLQHDDSHHIYGEQRYSALGEVDGFVMQVVWTPRGRTRRIISSRPANGREVAKYHGYRKSQI